MTSRPITGLVGLGLALGAGLAQAEGNLNARLKGDYALSQSRSCVEVAGTLSFDPVTFQIVPPGLPVPPFILRRFTSADRGTIHYNGDGTGSSTTLGTSIDSQSGAGSFPVSQAQNTCQIAYTVNADNSVDHHASCEFITTAGGGVGTTGTVTISTKRQIAEGKRAILHGTAEPPVIEKVTFMLPPSSFPNRERLCVRSGISSKLSGH